MINRITNAMAPDSGEESLKQRAKMRFSLAFVRLLIRLGLIEGEPSSFDSGASHE